MSRAQLDLAAWHWEMVRKRFVVSSVRSGSRHPIGRLYRALYNQIDQKYPELRAVMGSSTSVRGRILAYVTSDLYPLLESSPQFSFDYVLRILAANKRVNVTPAQFNPLGQALIQAIAEVSGPMYWTKEMKEAWRYMYCQCSVLLLRAQTNASSLPMAPTMADLPAFEGVPSSPTVAMIARSTNRSYRERTGSILLPVREQALTESCMVCKLNRTAF